MDKYLIKYLKENTNNELSSKYIDFFKIELDWHIYNSERHIAEVYHRNRVIGWKERLFNLYQYTNALFFNANLNKKKGLNILSTVHFEKDLLSSLGFNSYSPVWHALGKDNIFGDYKTVVWHEKTKNLIRNEDFFMFLDSKLHQEFEDFQSHLLEQYQKQDFRALFLNTDQYFYSKYSIDIFKKLDRPSFVFSHGLPGIYSFEVDNRSDYLMVWSEKIKQNYINIGFDPSKVKVVGNRKYVNIPKNKELKSSLDNILVIPVSSANWHQHEYDNIVHTDKSMVVLYLYKVQSVLKKLGVKKARYRVHPSINKEWVHAFLDHTFYVRDDETLVMSLNRSSLVIGSTSTVLLDSLIQGVNYIIFEPKEEDQVNMTGFKMVPPFDGSEEKLMVANDEIELEKMLHFNAVTDYSLVQDYVQDFDLTVLKELIK
ncbi:hypothetical protein [Flavobacterium sp. N2038]|uniref:hypothetical protein n=1 Tax=Flavobacterium sp. N2038 TaxID=2986829 RepID=UPI0022256573|nr:hypothetical protein [Flavobacterium sp. N2038]